MNPENPTEPQRFSALRRCLYVVIALVTLVALFYAEERFRGAHAWNRYCKDAQARGVTLDFAALIPPPIPDEENGANTPFVQNWFPKPKPDETNRWPELFGKANGRLRLPKSAQTHNQDDRRMTDFVAWQRAFAEARIPEEKGKRARREPRDDDVLETERNPEEQTKAALAVLEELKVYQPVIDELRVASKHSRVRYPVDYKLDEPFSILLPHLAKVKGLVQELKLQANVDLATGQTDRAFEDIRLMMWLTDSLEQEGFLISQLVRIAAQQIITQPIWEGLTEHKWSDAQLQEIQARMLRVNFADSISYSMSDERAGGIAFVQTAIRRGNLGEMLAMINSPEAAPESGDLVPKKALGWILPKGWLYLELVNYSSMMDGMIANGWDTGEKVFHPKTLDENERAFQAELCKGIRIPVLQHKLIARSILPALTRASTKFSRAQSTANQVALACALERYHKAHGTYPESLAELTPKFISAIPNEVVSMNPMRYQRTGSGYILYSVGWDGVDDGGALVNSKSGHPEKGDWVWRVDR